MSIRLFHKNARFVINHRAVEGGAVWRAIHRRPVNWARVFTPALLLVGFQPSSDADGLRFGEGSLYWTRGAMWTTIRLRLPPCSPKKAELLAAGLLKAARYEGE